MRAGTQDRAYWRAEYKHQQEWMAESPITGNDKDYGAWLICQQRIHGFAAGWIAGVARAKRQELKRRAA